MSKVLVISPDEIKKEMAGPAIRALEITRYLSREHQVTLVYRPTDLRRLILEHDVVICQHLALTQYPDLPKYNRCIIFDLYNLSMFECLQIAIKGSVHYQALFGEYHPLRKVYIDLLRAGDFFICANEKQRNFWLGMLVALGRIDIDRYREENNLKNIIDIVPFGIPDDSPVHTKDVLKGVYPGILTQDKVVIWAGGVYDWLDPLTSIKAVNKIVKMHPEIKLFFMGINNPNRPLLKMRLCRQAIKLSKDLGLYNENVFFNDWVDYYGRQNYLLESALGITTHHKNMESYFSSRTRILDYIWANLPMVITEGDGFSELVRNNNLGLVVRDSDIDGLTQAILRLLDDRDLYLSCKEKLKEIAPDFYWSKAIAALNRFCHSPRMLRQWPYNFKATNRLACHIFQAPYYISYYGYKGLMIKICKRILDKPRQLIRRLRNMLKRDFIFIFSAFTLLFTFTLILINDFLILPFLRGKIKR